jgi:dihydrofolate synthase/folylpolyglutamate synthase
MDHTQFLGSTLEQIAFEKAGIIKTGVPVVIGETTPETRTVFETVATETHAPITFAEDKPEVLNSHPSTKGFTYQTEHFGILEGELAGYYQTKNTNTVLCAVRQLERLGFMHPVNCDPESACLNKEVKEGFKDVCELTGLQGRWQMVCEKPKTICDTGHNLPGWEYLSKQLDAVVCHQMHILFGMVDDKDIEGVMALLPKNATYYFTKASSKRSVSENILKLYAQQLGLQGESYSSVSSAYDAIKKCVKNDDFVFIGGSSYVVADFLKNCI